MTRLPDPYEQPWLKVAELAEITGDGEKVIRAAIDAGQIPSIRVGRYIRIPTARFLREVLGIEPARNSDGPGPPDPGHALTETAATPPNVRSLHASA